MRVKGLGSDGKYDPMHWQTERGERRSALFIGTLITGVVYVFIGWGIIAVARLIL